ncbi:MAG: bifunctional phosphoribosyl-AMP cyclohydrolase/phosphoribosyl-ATP diphosphatase HisIE [Deltaproteobacteria bacterium]
MDFIEKLKYDDNGLVPAIAQDYKTGEVLMLAYMNKESLKLTIETKKIHYFSRSRQKLWLKGETSGNFQTLKSISYDCDGDTLLLKVEQKGSACHTGSRNCFFNTPINLVEEAEKDESFENVIAELYKVIIDRKNKPKEGSYTNYLFDKGLDKILKKVGEETAEVIIAAKNKSVDEIRYETADLMYHLAVLLVESGMSFDDIARELKGRRLGEDKK